jgi:hypothetical protein
LKSLHCNSLRNTLFEDKTLVNQHSVLLFNNKPYLVVVFYKNTRGNRDEEGEEERDARSDGRVRL